MRAEVAIVGNGVAATACALRLARNGTDVLLIGRGLPVDRPPLSKAALADGLPRLLSDEARLTERGVTRLEGLVREADLGTRRVTVVNDDAEEEVKAEHLVLATGLAYGVPPVPGLELGFINANPSAFETLGPLLTWGRSRSWSWGPADWDGERRHAGDSRALRTLVDVLERPLDRLHDPLPALGRATLDELGVRFLGKARIESATEYSVTTAAHGTLEADVILVATGGALLVPPGPPPGEMALPLAVGPDMGVPGRERVYACGDLVLVPHARFGSIHFPHWDAAIGTGEHVADTIAGDGGAYERLPYWWSDIGPRSSPRSDSPDAAAAWSVEDGLHVGRDGAGEIVCSLVVDEPRRLREARSLLAGGAG